MPNEIFDENTAFTATLSATDPDSTVFTYTLTNDPTGGAFQVVGDHMLPLAATPAGDLALDHRRRAVTAWNKPSLPVPEIRRTRPALDRLIWMPHFVGEHGETVTTPSCAATS